MSNARVCGAGKLHGNLLFSVSFLSLSLSLARRHSLAPARRRVEFSPSRAYRYPRSALAAATAAADARADATGRRRDRHTVRANQFFSVFFFS